MGNKYNNRTGDFRKGKKSNPNVSTFQERSNLLDTKHYGKVPSCQQEVEIIYTLGFETLYFRVFNQLEFLFYLTNDYLCSYPNHLYLLLEKFKND